VLRKIFERQSEEVTGEWRQLRNDELQGGKIKEDERDGANNTSWEHKKSIQNLS
jgi:hypothetical protein